MIGLDPTTMKVPYNLEAEQGLLGIILFHNRHLEAVSEIVAPEHFYDPVHGRIYAACLALVEKGQPANPVTLKPFFDEDKALDAVGRSEYLVALLDSVVIASNAPHYAQIIRDLAIRRTLMDAATDIYTEAATPDFNLTSTDILESAEAKLYEIAETRSQRSGPVSIDVALDEAFSIIQRAQTYNGACPGVPTGLADLDDHLGGMQGSELYILAGRPSMGKTALALTASLNAAMQGYSVLFYSLEMSRAALGMRLIAQKTGIPVQSQRRKMTPEQIASICEAQKQLCGFGLQIDDASAMTIHQMRTRARRMKRQKGLNLIVVDYIGLTGGDSKLQKVHQIEEITKGLKGIAKDLDVPVLALCQLNRGVEGRDDKRPVLSDLRDSGAIEQDADVVMFVYREEYYAAREEPRFGTDKNKMAEKMADWHVRMDACRGIGEVIIPKFRQGEIGTIRLAFDGPRQQFTNLAHNGRG